MTVCVHKEGVGIAANPDSGEIVQIEVFVHRKECKCILVYGPTLVPPSEDPTREVHGTGDTKYSLVIYACTEPSHDTMMAAAGKYIGEFIDECQGHVTLDGMAAVMEDRLDMAESLVLRPGGMML